MKVFIYYEDNQNTELHKTLKITLPKSWKDGPTSKLLDTFVESYISNESLGSRNPLHMAELHLSIKDMEGKLVMLASDAVILDVIPDRSDLYVCHGPSTTLAAMRHQQEVDAKQRQELLKNTVACTHFGCKNRFPKGGPYPDCCYHKSPPVFHETAKFWSCCPNKKAYDWETFEAIPGCMTGACTDVKETDAPQFLGGSDLRDKAEEAVKLKSIDEFNQSHQQGGISVLDRLQALLSELGVERELFDQVLAGIRMQETDKHASVSDAQLSKLVEVAFGKELKESFKAVAAKQLRLK
ncbi:hypothetical protein MPSEU_000482000 [Mayamaea pseudoterrestris]|nr:hypothetical protein MPSEU_000482000 [Mayamaea pseudoterrestris]